MASTKGHQAQSQGKLWGVHNVPTWEIKVQHQKEGKKQILIMKLNKSTKFS